MSRISFYSLIPFFIDIVLILLLFNYRRSILLEKKKSDKTVDDTTLEILEFGKYHQNFISIPAPAYVEVES
ncbi:hypothetical protein HDU92_004755 [Lobulomyces angularis]|nr:hypothetical protein HDU92_004755 [Lobulomyces angularis]